MVVALGQLSPQMAPSNGEDAKFRQCPIGCEIKFILEGDPASCAGAFLIPALTAQNGIIRGIRGSSKKRVSGQWVGNGHFAFCWKWPWQVPSPSSPCWRGDTPRWFRLTRGQAKERSLSGPHPAAADPSKCVS